MPVDGEVTAASAVAGAGTRQQFRMPDFFIAGHAKCGTTALYFLLNSHPRTHMPVKEPRFFAPDLRSPRWRPRSSLRLHPTTLDGYLSLFAGAREDQLVGEASSSYLRSEVAAELIATVAPEAKVIAILREPVRFLQSFHLQSVRNYDETETDFRRAIELEPARREGRHLPRFSQEPKSVFYSDHVRYAEQIRRFHERLGHEQVKVLIYEDFRADNQATIHDVQRFLDLEEREAIPRAEVTPLRPVRFQSLDQLSRGWHLMRSNGVIPGRRQGRRPGAPGLARRTWERVLYTEARPLEESFVRELRRSFKPQVEAASEYLGRDLVSLWGYDRLD
jgi:hypothetical protein